MDIAANHILYDLIAVCPAKIALALPTPHAARFAATIEPLQLELLGHHSNSVPIQSIFNQHFCLNRPHYHENFLMLRWRSCNTGGGSNYFNLLAFKCSKDNNVIIFDDLKTM